MSAPATFVPDNAPATFESDKPTSFVPDSKSVSATDSQNLDDIRKAFADVPEKGGYLGESLPHFARRNISEFFKKDSLLGISPEREPSGAEITKTLGIRPDIAETISSINKVAAGVAGFLTSPSGIAQTSALAVPILDVGMATKWTYDMIKGGYLNIKDAIDAYKKGDTQRLRDNIIGATASFVGALGVGKGAQVKSKIYFDSLKPTAGEVLAPKTTEAVKATIATPAQTKVEPVKNIQDVVPAIETMTGELKPADKGTSHNEAIEKHGLTAEDINKRTYMDVKTGEEVPPEQLAEAGLPTAHEEGKTDRIDRVHSDTLAKAQEQPVISEKPIAKEPWQMSRDEFSKAIIGGKLYLGKNTPVVGKTGIAMGEHSGYPPNDIAAWYVASMGGKAKLSNEPGIFKILESATSEQIDAGRERYLQHALAEGKPVPAEVLADYPDLKPPEVKPAQPTPQQGAKGADPIETLNKANAVTVTLPEDATMFQVSHKKGQWSEPMSPDALSKAGKGKVANTMLGTDPIAIRGVSVGKGKTVKVSKGKVDVQEFVGLGAAAEGEVGTGGGADIYGIAQAAREARAKAGQVAEVPTGEGITAPDSVEHGRELLSKGADPEKSLLDFERTKKLSADDMALVRAKGEELSKAARSIEEKFGTDSNEYRMAWKALSDWDTRTKPMQTEWHKIGEAQQGATDIDTGTFTGLQRAYKELSGKEFTPTQVTEAKKIAKKTQLVAKEAESAKQRLLQQLELELGKVDVPAPKNMTEAKMLFSKFAEGKNFTPQQIKTLWNAAKKFYLEKGVTDFDDIRNGLATDFGIPVNDVSRALAQPKGVKRITDEMYSKMSQQRALQNSAKSWLKNTAMPGWLRFARGIPRIFFTTKILGHGTVGMITHAGNVMFNPWAWKVYWPTFLKQYKLMYNSAYHERLMQDLMRSPNYVTARRGGLANDPFSYKDDYQNPAIVQYLGNIGLIGNRGFDSLKLLRQGLFDLHWDKLPESLKTPEMAKLLSDSANHASGIVKMQFREWASWSFFAPKLEGSRWAWMVGDPYKAAKTFKEWKSATPEERVFAMGELKQKATVAGVYFSLLAINQGMLSSMNSDQKINFDNPRRGDFLAFKVAGHNLGIISPMIGMVKLFSNLVHDSIVKRSKLEELSTRSSEFGTTGISYIRGKSSPFTSFAWDIASQADFQGRPLPFSKDKTPAWLRKQGYKKFTYPEYAAEEFTPIPVEEAIKEVWKAQGMNDNQIATYMKAITVAGIMGGTGARLSEDTHKTKP